MLKKGLALIMFFVVSGCSKDSSYGSVDDLESYLEKNSKELEQDSTENDDFNIGSIKDSYSEIAPFENFKNWGPHNVHDPSIFKDGDTYYSYSTDVAYGTSVRPGLQIRKSKDLIKWDFVGWVFNSIPEKGSAYIESKGAIPNNSLWAPYVFKHNDEYRLYYSLASNVGRVSVIGLAVASSPEGPWTERNIVVGTDQTNSAQTNGIDPTVLKTSDGSQYMFYGSSWDGMHFFELNPDNGLNANSNNRGKRIAHRGLTNGFINGNIEAPEIIYNKTLGYYYLFISYDWLETKYNIRVGRSRNPSGPFLDYFGNDLNEMEDNVPMIVAPYRFDNHSGWQGVAHNSAFEDENGNYYIAHQGRPGVDKYFMNMHVRKLYWTPDGWPIASPQRYAGVSNEEVQNSEIAGSYEFIDFEYNVVPGYAEEQISPDFQESILIELNENGTINNSNDDTWEYEEGILKIFYDSISYELLIFRGRDWENDIESTLLFSGLNPSNGYAVWGKKTN